MNNFSEIMGFLRMFKDMWIQLSFNDQPSDETEDLVKLVHSAQRDWQIALHNFNNCYDNDMIDYCIYNLEAAEKKYICLLDRAKKQSVKLSA